MHAIFPGPLATWAAFGIPEFDKSKGESAARSLVTIEDVGTATAFLTHDATRLIAGSTICIDRGYQLVD